MRSGRLGARDFGKPLDGFVNCRSNIEQSKASAAANAAYFLQHLRDYRESIASIDTYRTLHDFISKKVMGVNELLDVGNGGVFDYDVSQVGRVTAVDLFLGDLPAEIVA